jgi:hypothetical protein
MITTQRELSLVVQEKIASTRGDIRDMVCFLHVAHAVEEITGSLDLN